ncbi:U8-agatoxin-Ao1a-like isoform X2 [Galleria mellonella]|uniref:U8-agatoxin-Ao1a-like isoform X2 n=1 Tax=Galleria mellonella TaxID=7137 RepID=A0ABM3MFG4_GALME|nr:U8-agatoxin-Ao1a-like isoform X2 [Galleria mellonella]
MASSGWCVDSMPRAGALLLALAAVLLAAEWAHASYIDPGDDDLEVNLQDYGEDPGDLQLLQDVGKRACIRRGGNCDHRPGDCCHSSSCRCNLWGSNCRCQRMGLFQKWG